jgi:hypothetical protein
MGEDEARANDVADLAGADGDVLQRPPAAGEQGEPAFAQAAQRPLEGVAGAGIDIEALAAGRLAHRDVDADPGVAEEPGMAEPPDQMPAAAGSGGLGASHADREQVIGSLKAAFVQGMLAKEECDLRVAQTFAARTYAQLAAITADLPAGLTLAKRPQAARVQGEPHIPRVGRVLAVATAVYAAIWPVAFSLPVSGPDHVPHAGVALAGTATFFYVILLLMAGTPILADWLNKHWQPAARACHQATRADRAVVLAPDVLIAVKVTGPGPELCTSSGRPSGLTARARPEDRPEARSTNLPPCPPAAVGSAQYVAEAGIRHGRSNSRRCVDGVAR